MCIRDRAIAKVAPLIDDRPVLAGAIGPFSLAGRLMDVSEVMVMCYEEPELVHAVLEKAAEFVAAYADAFRAAGADGVVLAEPLAGLLSPDLAEEFSSAYVRRIVKEVQTDSFAVVYHSCGGGVPKMMDSIVDTGAAAFHFGNAISMADVMPLVPADRVATVSYTHLRSSASPAARRSCSRAWACRTPSTTSSTSSTARSCTTTPS